MHHIKANGMRHLIPIIDLSFVKIQLTSLNTAYSASLSLCKLKISLTPFMKDLQRDLDKEGIELLVKKEKNAEGFSNILDHLHKTFIHPSWPLSDLEEDSYNFDYAPPYSNFLNLNSSSLQLYVPYHTCYDDVICTQEGIFVNFYIGNPHYFAEMHFILLECYSILPMPPWYQDKSNTSSTYQSRKETRTKRWLSINGISKRKNRLLPINPGIFRNVSQRNTPSFSLLHYLAKTFIDNYFSDLL